MRKVRIRLRTFASGSVLSIWRICPSSTLKANRTPESYLNLFYRLWQKRGIGAFGKKVAESRFSKMKRKKLLRFSGLSRVIATGNIHAANPAVSVIPAAGDSLDSDALARAIASRSRLVSALSSKNQPSATSNRETSSSNRSADSSRSV